MNSKERRCRIANHQWVCNFTRQQSARITSMKQRIHHLLCLCTLALAAFTANAQETNPPAAKIRWSVAILRQKPEWYASAEARPVADSVIQYQSLQGGWPKSTDLATPPSSPESLAETMAGGRANTIDNGATTTPMHFLALMVQATREAKYRESFARGLDYLFAAQYPNGGWPQFFPLRKGYYSHITYNDNAMVNVLTVLRNAAAG